MVPPAISTLTRSTETNGVVSFTVPPSEQDAEYFEVLLYVAANSTTFDEVLWYNLMVVDVKFSLILLNRHFLLM